MFKGTREGRKRPTPNARKGNSPNSDRQGQPNQREERKRKELHDLELARDSMSIAKDSQLTNCSRVL